MSESSESVRVPTEARGRLVVHLLGGATLAVILGTAWPPLHSFWLRSDTYSHGYLLVAVALWLAWRNFKRSPRSPSASAAGAFALASVLLALLAARAADVLVVQFAAVALLPLAALWAFAGWPSAKRLAAPTAIVAFAVPAWDSINEPLRALTTSVVGYLARLAGIPAFIDGNSIHIPSGTFLIEGGCAGLHYFIVGCTLGLLYGLLTFHGWRPRAVAVAAAAALSLLANWIRVLVIVIAGHATDMNHYLVTVDHYYFGWIVFFGVMTPALLAAHRWAKPDALVEPAADEPRRKTGHGPQLASLGVLSVAAFFSVQLAMRPGEAVAGVIALPESVGEWRLDGQWTSSDRPLYRNPATEAGVWYRRSDVRVGVYVAHYPVQSQGAEVVFYANRPQGEGGEIVRRSRPSGRLAVTELEVQYPHAGRRVVWYGYEVAGHRAATAAEAKLLGVLGALLRRWDASAWVLSAPCEPDCDRARESLAELTSGFDPLSLITPFSGAHS